MYLSAVILTYNSERHIGACLTALMAALGNLPGPSEIFVVDNGSSDGTLGILEAFAPPDGVTVQPILLARNEGTTAARNRALRRSTGAYVLILDADAIVLADALGPLIAHLDGNPRAGLVAPRLTFPDGRAQLSVDRFPTIGRKAQRALFLRALEEAERPAEAGAPPRPVDYAISAFWLLPRRTLDRVGLLDERYFYAPEDVDYCLAIWLTGLTVDYYPAVSAVHDAAERSRGWPFSRFALRHALGLMRYFLKWRYGLGRARLYRRIAAAQAAPLTATPASTPGT